jgi:hypothetical protein
MSTEMLITAAVQLVSTVLGVYLAARAAHRNTLERETVRNERDSYFMRAALLDELKDNLAALQAWGRDFQAHLDRDPAIEAHRAELMEGADEAMARDGQAWVAWWKAGSAFRHTYVGNNPAQLELSTLIWDTLKNQDLTFQLPSNFLSAVRRFYGSTTAAMQDIATRDRLERTQRAAVTIWEGARHMREEVIPAFEKSLAERRRRLEAKGVTLEG